MQNKRVALVTGAKQGIGLQIVKDLVAHGFTVLVGSRNFERSEAAAKEARPDAHALQLDATDQASIAAAAERVHQELGRLDGLVQNAAISALNALTIAMAIELEPKWIKVNAVSPGFIKTNLNNYGGTGNVEEAPASRSTFRNRARCTTKNLGTAYSEFKRESHV